LHYRSTNAESHAASQHTGKKHAGSAPAQGVCLVLAVEAGSNWATYGSSLLKGHNKGAALPVEGQKSKAKVDADRDQQALRKDSQSEPHQKQ